jgi:hypothetical protein
MDNLRGSNVESKSLWEFIISVGRIKRTLDLHEIINELNALFYQFFLLILYFKLFCGFEGLSI